MDQLNRYHQHSIQLTREQFDIMRADVALRFPEEACGLVAGLAGRVQSVSPVTNILRSPVRYRMDPHEQLHFFKTIEENRWELTAIYHSHPNGPEKPSRTDIDECYYPDVIQLIWFKKLSDWSCKGYYIQSGLVTPVEVEILENQ